MVLEQVDIYMQNIDFILTSYTKIDSKCIMDLNGKVKPMKLLEKIGENICYLELNKNVLAPKV